MENQTVAIIRRSVADCQVNFFAKGPNCDFTVAGSLPAAQAIARIVARFIAMALRLFAY